MVGGGVGGVFWNAEFWEGVEMMWWAGGLVGVDAPLWRLWGCFWGNFGGKVCVF